MNKIDTAEITAALWFIVSLMATLIYLVSNKWAFLIIAIPTSLWGLWCAGQAIYFMGKASRNRGGD